MYLNRQITKTLLQMEITTRSVKTHANTKFSLFRKVSTEIETVSCLSSITEVSWDGGTLIITTRGRGGEKCLDKTWAFISCQYFPTYQYKRKGFFLPAFSRFRCTLTHLNNKLQIFLLNLVNDIQWIDRL